MAVSASPFIIRELTGDKREFRFTGRGLPYRPFTLSGTQRHDITWYAGSPEGTIQMLGAQEDETTVNGKWKDRFLRQVEDMSPAEQEAAGFTTVARANAGVSAPAAGQYGEAGAMIDGSPVNNVRELAEQIDDVRRKGQYVEVSWVNQLRQGIIASFRQSWDTAQDLEWEIRFVWINQGIQLASIPIQDRSIDLSDSVVQFANQLDVLASLQDGSIPIDLRQTSAGQALSTINSSIDKMEQALEQLQDTIIVNTQAFLSPVATAQRAIGILTFLVEIGEDTANSIDRSLDSAILNVEGLFGAKLDQRNVLSKQKRAARRISGIAAIRKEQLEKQVRPELVRAFTSREDQDLRDVALEFYGRADEWRSLLRFNNLSTSRLSANQLIFVPRNPPQVDQC
jgi:hypothetical protein